MKQVRSNNPLFLGMLLLFVLAACSSKTEIDKSSQWQQELEETEASFAKLAGKEGIHAAFVAYAADDAVIMRNNELIKGKTSIDSFYQGSNEIGLQWKPEFIGVSESGDLGYTYGFYTYTFHDSLGNQAQNKGVFHTVWKRQTDGSWKFVWD